MHCERQDTFAHRCSSDSHFIQRFSAGGTSRELRVSRAVSSVESRSSENVSGISNCTVGYDAALGGGFRRLGSPTLVRLNEVRQVYSLRGLSD